MRIEEHIMKSKNIEKVNHALLVLRHFIDLSSKLLPFLDEINNKANPSAIDRIDRVKIIELYNIHQFDDATSKMLIDSNVLFLIKVCNERLTKNQSASRLIQAFDIEFNRLRKNWQKIDEN
jgi:chaperonin GroEL (HSP60 family)